MKLGGSNHRAGRQSVQPSPSGAGLPLRLRAIPSKQSVDLSVSAPSTCGSDSIVRGRAITDGSFEISQTENEESRSDPPTPLLAESSSQMLSELSSTGAGAYEKLHTRTSPASASPSTATAVALAAPPAIPSSKEPASTVPKQHVAQAVAVQAVSCLAGQNKAICMPNLNVASFFVRRELQSRSNGQLQLSLQLQLRPLQTQALLLSRLQAL
jgi:hypothetical protein